MAAQEHLGLQKLEEAGETSPPKALEEAQPG